MFARRLAGHTHHVDHGLATEAGAPAKLVPASNMRFGVKIAVSEAPRPEARRGGRCSDGDGRVVTGSGGTLLVLGASGDLAGRLLLPAVGQLLGSAEGPSGLTLVGAGTEDWDDATWRERVAAAFASVRATGARIDEITAHTKYLTADVTRPEDLQRLLDACDGAPAIYFALPPAVTAKACAALGQLTLPPGTALVLEKPFGVDQSSAADLNTIIGRLVPEDQIHRVDHFLGKSTVLNLLGLRFTNRLFEPLWSADHIARVDIVFDEPLGLENRARYYDGAGALVDMIQSHLLQVLALIAMDPPASLYARDLRDRKAEALRACRVWAGDPVAASRRARYTSGVIDGRQLPGYAEESGVDPARQTETLAEVVLRGGYLAVGGCPVPVAVREGPGKWAERNRDHVQTGTPVAAGVDRGGAAHPVTDLDGSGPVGARPEHQRARRPVRDRSGHPGRGFQSRSVARLRGSPCRSICGPIPPCPCGETPPKNAGGSSIPYCSPGGKTRSHWRITRPDPPARQPGPSRDKNQDRFPR